MEAPAECESKNFSEIMNDLTIAYVQFSSELSKLLSEAIPRDRTLVAMRTQISLIIMQFLRMLLKSLNELPFCLGINLKKVITCLTDYNTTMLQFITMNSYTTLGLDVKTHVEDYVVRCVIVVSLFSMLPEYSGKINFLPENSTITAEANELILTILDYLRDAIDNLPKFSA
jgi:hypothetical protein